jgi:hypothetical protein
VALPVWALVDSISRPRRYWEATGLNKGLWVGALAATAPFGVGFVVALGYLFKARRPISSAEIVSQVALWGDEALF